MTKINVNQRIVTMKQREGIFQKNIKFYDWMIRSKEIKNLLLFEENEITTANSKRKQFKK